VPPPTPVRRRKLALRRRRAAENGLGIGRPFALKESYESYSPVVRESVIFPTTPTPSCSHFRNRSNKINGESVANLGKTDEGKRLLKDFGNAITANSNVRWFGDPINQGVRVGASFNTILTPDGDDHKSHVHIGIIH
jgi:hypothetical protein